MKTNTYKVDSKKFLKNIDWKSFFNMRLFRYTFLRQLKWSIAYLCFFMAIIWNVIYFSLSFSSFKQVAKIATQLETYSLTFFLYMFIIFTFNKSLEVFREEIDDGTLLIINSMPYSRLKLVIQKWLSLQVVCSIFVLSVVLLSPIISLLFHGFSLSAWIAFKLVYKNSLWLITRFTIIQIFASSFALIVSLYFGQKTTLAAAVLFMVSIVGSNYLLKYLFPNSFKVFDGVVIYITYLLIGLGLLGLLIYVLHRKDFV